MAGIGIPIPRTGPGTGPFLPLPLHDNGVAGATHRYVPERLNLAAGAEVSSIPDLIGSAPLSAVGAASNVLPIIAATGGQKYMEMVAGANNKALENTSLDLGSTFTVAVVVRTAGGNGTGMNISADGYSIHRAGNNTWQLDGYSGSAQAGINGPALTSDFVVLFGICDGANTRLGVNAAITANAGSITGPIAGLNNVLRWGFPTTTTPTAGSQHDYVEMNTWPVALDATQRAAHFAAMKAKWSALLP